MTNRSFAIISDVIYLNYVRTTCEVIPSKATQNIRTAVANSFKKGYCGTISGHTRVLMELVARAIDLPFVFLFARGDRAKELKIHTLLNTQLGGELSRRLDAIWEAELVAAKIYESQEGRGFHHSGKQKYANSAKWHFKCTTGAAKRALKEWTKIPEYREKLELALKIIEDGKIVLIEGAIGDEKEGGISYSWKAESD